MKTKSQQSEEERLALIMAEFLGYEKVHTDQYWFKDDEEEILFDSNIGEYFFPTEDHPHPPGFLAVWDKLDEKYDTQVRIIFSHEANKNYTGLRSFCYIIPWGMDVNRIKGKGPDRYTAFYTAIEKMTEGEG